jgi:tight adherence protein C
VINVPAWQVGLLLSVFCAVAGLLLLLTAERNARAEARIRSVRKLAGANPDVVSDQVPALTRFLGAIGGSVLRSGLLSRKAIDDLEQTMEAGGQRSGAALALFVGTKIVLFFGLPLLAWIFLAIMGSDRSPLLFMVISAIIGLMLPDVVLRRVRASYIKAVEAGLPVALDLLIICAEAGLALEAGMERVAEESQDGARATANELRITANEMKILADRRQALVNMGTRTGLDSMVRLGGTLAQSMKYGTPLTLALRTLAAELRQSMLTRFEARAAKIPVLLTIPMILFILPCIFVVVAGPAGVRVMQAMSSR